MSDYLIAEEEAEGKLIGGGGVWRQGVGVGVAGVLPGFQVIPGTL